MMKTNETASSNSEQKCVKGPCKTAIFAGGCFWGVEHYMQAQPGVISVESGYTGGQTENPSYEQVKSQMTGHAEAVRITYDPRITDYETLLRFFFEIHDPTQNDGQGVDIGSQYRSEIFFQSEQEKNITLKVIAILRDKGYDVVTRVTKAGPFYLAEAYHQDYFEHHEGEPDCHFYTPRF
ncbi:MAG: peptide-methionine (S)-S-oxide reductase MsrA [Bacteroidaceae bacterium]